MLTDLLGAGRPALVRPKAFMSRGDFKARRREECLKLTASRFGLSEGIRLESRSKRNWYKNWGEKFGDGRGIALNYANSAPELPTVVPSTPPGVAPSFSGSLHQRVVTPRGPPSRQAQGLTAEANNPGSMLMPSETRAPTEHMWLKRDIVQNALRPSRPRGEWVMRRGTWVYTGDLCGPERTLQQNLDLYREMNSRPMERTGHEFIGVFHRRNPYGGFCFGLSHGFK